MVNKRIPIKDNRGRKLGVKYHNMVEWFKKNREGFGVDIAKAISSSPKIKYIGIRPGEKLHEEMITTSDSFSTVDIGNYYVVLPSDGDLVSKYLNSSPSIVKVPDGFAYNSATNSEFLSVAQLRSLIKTHVDTSFEPFSL